jgi:hypothetical protein
MPPITIPVHRRKLSGPVPQPNIHITVTPAKFGAVELLITILSVTGIAFLLACFGQLLQAFLGSF